MVKLERVLGHICRTIYALREVGLDGTVIDKGRKAQMG